MINLEEIKNRLEPISLLQYIGYSKSHPQIRSNEVRDFCPIHDSDTQRSLAINKQTGEWNCHSCNAKGGDLISLYIQAKKLDPQHDFKEVLEGLSSTFGIPIEKTTNQPPFTPLLEKPIQPNPQEPSHMIEPEKLELSKKNANKVWEQAQIEGNHPYFKKKGVTPPVGVKYAKDEKNNPSIVLPYYDVQGVLQAVQYINERGKFFAKDSTPGSAFFILGSLEGSTQAYLCEGVATALSVWESENKAIPTLSCGSSLNIVKVTKEVKKAWPNLNLIICLDDDHTAKKVAEEVTTLNLHFISFRKPDFTGINRRKIEKEGIIKWLDKDFNDLHQTSGIETVREQIQKNWTPPLPEKETQKKSISLLPLSQLPINYLTEKPPEKPQLLYKMDKNGKKIAFLPKEIVAMLIAEGGAGKTHLLCLLAMSVITGIPFLNHFEVNTPGAVCFIVGENNDKDLHRLIWKMHKNLEKLLEENKQKTDGNHFGLHYEKPLNQILNRFYPFSVHGMNASFIDGKGKPTKFYESLLDELIKNEPEEGWQLIILDPISRFAGLEAEKDNALATMFITCAERLSSSLRGNPTVLLSHHKSKAALGEHLSGQGAGRGSSAFTDGARWQANLDVKDREARTSFFYVSKTNFTGATPKFTIRKNYEGIPEFDKWSEQ